MSPRYYVILVERQLGPGVAALFPELDLSELGGATLMRGALADQAALHGVLTRIRDLGLTLLALTAAPALPEHAAAPGPAP
jgi:hypothetical protein